MLIDLSTDTLEQLDTNTFHLDKSKYKYNGKYNYKYKYNYKLNREAAKKVLF